jgi:hypothetical protein
VRRLLRDPLFHFALIGMLLFAGYGVLGGTDTGSTVVDLGEADVAALQAGWAQQWGRPPSDEELAGLIEDHVRQEILYREALALGLDRGDTIVRRRMAQKMEFLATDSALVPTPSDENLAAFLAEHRERFEIPGSVSFQQIYFGRDRHGDAVETAATAALVELRGDPSADAVALGDRFLLPMDQRGLSDDRVGQVFGDDFARAVLALPVGGWQGPVPSGYGLHLVKLEVLEPRRDARLAEVRDVVAREWEAAQREEANRAFYRELRARYEVRVDTGE